MNPQPFYTSKGFWTSFLAFASLIYYMWKNHNWDPNLISTSLLVVLSNVFRWTADQPLALTGQRNPPPPPDAPVVKRLTKD